MPACWNNICVGTTYGLKPIMAIPTTVSLWQFLNVIRETLRGKALSPQGVALISHCKAIPSSSSSQSLWSPLSRTSFPWKLTEHATPVTHITHTASWIPAAQRRTLSTVRPTDSSSKLTSPTSDSVLRRGVFRWTPNESRRPKRMVKMKDDGESTHLSHSFFIPLAGFFRRPSRISTLFHPKRCPTTTFHRNHPIPPGHRQARGVARFPRHRTGLEGAGCLITRASPGARHRACSELALSIKCSTLISTHCHRSTMWDHKHEQTETPTGFESRGLTA